MPISDEVNWHGNITCKSYHLKTPYRSFTCEKGNVIRSSVLDIMAMISPKKLVGLKRHVTCPRWSGEGYRKYYFNK